MATVTTVSPSVQTRPHRPPVAETPGSSIAGAVDLSTREGWSYLSSFVVGGLGLAYNSSGPTVDIAQGRIARRPPDAPQELLTVGAVTGVSLASGATNYLYFRADNVIEVRDADEPPSPEALLIGTVNTSNDTVTEAVRGRSPVSQFATAGGGGGGGGGTTLAAFNLLSGTVPDDPLNETRTQLDSAIADPQGWASGNQLTLPAGAYLIGVKVETVGGGSPDVVRLRFNDSANGRVIAWSQELYASRQQHAWMQGQMLTGDTYELACSYFEDGSGASDIRFGDSANPKSDDNVLTVIKF
jgi:YD repeat-containing protein